MFKIFLFVRCSKRISNYMERITLSNLTHMMSMANHMDISVEIPRIDSGCYLEKEFIKLIYMNPQRILYLNFNQIDLCHGCVRGLLI